MSNHTPAPAPQALTSILQIIKIDDPRSGIKDGREWKMQEAQCIVLNDDGTPAEVGVLTLPKHLMDGAIGVGVYVGSFALRANKGREGGRKIEAVLTDLKPYAVKASKA